MLRAVQYGVPGGRLFARREFGAGGTKLTGICQPVIVLLESPHVVRTYATSGG